MVNPNMFAFLLHDPVCVSFEVFFVCDAWFLLK